MCDWVVSAARKDRTASVCVRRSRRSRKNATLSGYSSDGAPIISVVRRSVVFFSARRHASAGTMATALCPSLSLCVCHKSVFYRNGLNESGWILARELPSTYPTLCCKEIQIPSSLLWLLSSESLLQTRDLENFASAYRSSKRVIYLARERWTLRA